MSSAERIRALLDGWDICTLEDDENNPETECSRQRGRLVAALRGDVERWDDERYSVCKTEGNSDEVCIACEALAAIEKALRGEK